MHRTETNIGLGKDWGLYEARREHDACGIGAVVNISGRRDRDIVTRANQVILNLQHRGAAGADETTGDGAGILLQIPHELFAAELNAGLPAPGFYAVATVFQPRDRRLAALGAEILGSAIAHHRMRVIAWRDVPTDNRCLGDLARKAEPVVRQVFIDGGGRKGEALERALFLARKRAERLLREKLGPEGSEFYVCSMSARTICYKGMFLADQLFGYYDDLRDDRTISALAIVHQRYSTNTLPNWRLAQPFHIIAHNGEINTLSGNRNRIRSREQRMACKLLGDDLTDLRPVLTEGASDSAQFDNCLELLVRAGRSLPHAMMMMVPEAFGSMYHISTDKRAFYEYHAAIMEPWDGPAAMVFTDGRIVGGTLDRNGLRPARYLVTTDGLVVLASETGVIEFPPEQVAQRGRLQPGRMFLVDTEQGRLVVDNEIKSKIARQKPYRRWLAENRIELRGLFDAAEPVAPDPETLGRKMRMFGYTREELTMVLAPMATHAQEPVGSMGTDTPLAVLSNQPKLLFNYFKQLFAQVTNPPIDPLREGLVMSLMLFTGKRRNLLDETPEHCRQLKLPHPILTSTDLQRLRAASREDFKVATVDALFDAADADPAGAMRRGIERMLDAAERAVKDGASLLVLSDRDTSKDKAPLPALLATAALHHGMLDRHIRAEAGIVVESGEPREVMHFCLLMGYGANAVNPYVGLAVLDELRRRGDVPADIRPVRVVDNYIAAIKKGMLKTMSKMGISTLRSYRSAQVFECIGLNRDVVDAYFTGTTSRIGGLGLEQIAREALQRHAAAFGERIPGELPLEFGGEYHFRMDGENHLWNPESVMHLQHAVRNEDPEAYQRFARSINDQSQRHSTLRGLFEFAGAEPVPIEEVEPAERIVRRFNTGAMSHGSISAEAHETMAVAMNRLGGLSNTGEGGEDPARYAPRQDGDSSNCGIKQIASGRFGVTLEYLSRARMLQIKMAQGAKPGEGGQLPGHKVTEEIARLRHSTPGVSLISPPPHHDIYSIEDLAQLIYDLKCVGTRCESPTWLQDAPADDAPVEVSVKLVAEVGVGTIAAGVAKGHADEVLISGHDGGTGASPLSSIKHAGCPWELGLAETQQVLVANGLRDRVVVQVDGQLKTGRDVVIGALLGAERFGFGTGAIVSLGCILMRKCHHGTCPVGIATQRPELRKKFAGKPEHLMRYLTFVAEEVRRIMAELGFRAFDEMIGRCDRLATRGAIEHYKAAGLDLSAIFVRPDTSDGRGVRRLRRQVDPLGKHLDFQIIEMLRAAGVWPVKTEQDTGGTPVVPKNTGGMPVVPETIELPIRNVHRTVGAILSNRIVRAHGAKGLEDGTIDITFRGSAGQSFGAFLAPGVTLRLIGDANDYLGKGLSGGRIVVRCPAEAPYEPHENIIVGNTLLYGATAGEVFINGLAGERFAVRNSGATAVVEGLGDHGCEYMTGGLVVVLGRTGRNFAAGMSGGIAYVLDERQLFDTRCNLDMVDLETVWQDPDVAVLHDLIRRHHEWTASPQAGRILDNWNQMVGRFVKVMPIDYRQALQRMTESEQRQTEFTPATEEVYRG